MEFMTNDRVAFYNKARYKNGDNKIYWQNGSYSTIVLFLI